MKEVNSAGLPAVARPTDAPNVAALISEFKRCSPWDGRTWNRVQTNEDIRFNRWAGQHPDGRKHDLPNKPAFPWDGASDCRCPLADAIINESVAVCVTSIWRALTKPKARDDEAGQYAVALLDYLVDEKLFHELTREFELSAQHREVVGWVVLHPTWDKQVALENREVTMDDLLAVAQQAGPDSPLGALPLLIADPTLEEQAEAVLAQLYGQYARMTIADVADIEVPELSAGTLGRLVRDLREHGKATVPMPYLCRNQVSVAALKPWEEVFISGNTTDINGGGRVWQRVWMTEEQVRAKILTDGWDKDWVELAVKQQGKYSSWNGTGPTSGANPPPTTLSEAMVSTNTTTWTQVDLRDGLIEVIYATYWQLDPDNVPAIYYTVFHPAISVDARNRPSYAIHGLVEEAKGEIPYVVGARENWSRTIISSRGVPEIVNTWQRMIKVQCDGIVDWTSLGVNPPLNVYETNMSAKYRFGAGMVNTVKAGREPKLMEIPDRGTPVAFETIQMVNADVDNYFGRMSESVPLPRQQAKQQMMVNSFLLMWGKAFQQMLGLCQRFMPDAEFAAATGAPKGWLEKHRKTARLLHADLHFDVREFDPDYLKQLMVGVDSVLGTDGTGIVNKSEVTKWKMQVVSPKLARRFITDEGAASQIMVDKVKTNLVNAMLGVEPTYEDASNDPTAPFKLDVAKKVIGSNQLMQSSLPPEMLQEIFGQPPNPMMQHQPNPMFTAIVEKYLKNLTLGAEQQQNKVTGRLAVTPGAV